DRALVSDTSATGTTVLTARSGVELDPQFGPGSHDAHVAAGAVALAVDVPGLRRDVDTAADLAAAVALGVGPATRAALAR
ncbi:MAG: 2-phospho-L-lactate guanylyltransferase, partial [Frankia sp.]|nr:2-phospho-L-lactate guanylyltransferase [Frankia sp.]